MIPSVRLLLTTLVLIAFLFYSEIGSSQAYQLFINEFMASNRQSIADDAGEYDDWIELYNAENFEINLYGYYLTDNLKNPTKWAFPRITIPAKGFLLLWADNDLPQPGLHTNFKLDKDGEQIGWYDGTTYVDSINFRAQYTDISYGRKEDGTPEWAFFEAPYNPPTPGTTNVYIIVESLKPPVFNPDEGFYSGSISVELSVAEPGAVVYYSLDGSIPTFSSIRYTRPIAISSPTTIRAISYQDIQSGDNLMSEVATNCYLLNVENAMTLTNIVCDQNEHDHIYHSAQPGEDHPSIAAHYKYFDENLMVQADLPIALYLRGGYSLLSPKKSYKVVFNKQNLQFDIFDKDYNEPRSPDLPTSFHSLDVSGMASDYSLLRNYLSHQLLRAANANSPQVSLTRLFVNGNDRGIYIPIEFIDEWFVENRFGNGDYDIIKTGLEHECDLAMQNFDGAYFELKAGDFLAFNAFITWLNSGSHTYKALSEKLDIPSFLYYDLMCRYSNNKDSYDINYYLVRKRDALDAKWIILIWDADESFGWDSRVIGNWYPYNKAFYQLRQTNEYIHLYQNTLADLMNTIWSQPNVSMLVEKMEDLFHSDNPSDEALWNDPWYEYAENIIPDFADDPNYNPLSRYKQFAFLKQWVGNRIGYLYHLWDNGTAMLTIESPNGGEGTIQLNSLQLTEFPWSGTYFKKIPIPLTAIPAPGFHFVGWSDPAVPQTEEITIALHDNYRIHAIFEYDTQNDTVVINEINYNSAIDFNPEDWIELYNPSSKTIDISGWHLKDDDHAHDFTFPPKTTLDPYGFLILCRDTTLFHSLFSAVTNYIGNFDFGLNGDSDEVRTYNTSHRLIDSIKYSDRAPWPTEADGMGPTLELLDPKLDNTLAENWQASAEHGSPGKPTIVLPVVTSSITGKVNYDSQEQPVADVMMTLTNAKGTSSDTTDDNGNYVFSSIAPGEVTLLPAKSGDLRNGINGADALFILKYLVFLVRLSDDEKFAADVIEDGEITGADLQAILRYLAFFTDNIGSTGQWRFVPNDSTFTLNSDTTISFKAYLFGDANLDRDSTQNIDNEAGINDAPIDVTLRIDRLTINKAESIEIPVIIEPVNEVVNTLLFSLEYDPGYFVYQKMQKTMSRKDFMVEVNTTEPGKIHVAMAGLTGLKSKDVIFRFTFKVVPPSIQNRSTKLTFVRALANDKPARRVNGEVKFVGPEINPERKDVALYQNYPNPFNSETQLCYHLPLPSHVLLTIYNVMGKEIRVMVNETQTAGSYRVVWDGRANNDMAIPSGVYFFELKVEGFTQTKKMIMMR